MTETVQIFNPIKKFMLEDVQTKQSNNSNSKGKNLDVIKIKNDKAVKSQRISAQLYIKNISNYRPDLIQKNQVEPTTKSIQESDKKLLNETEDNLVMKTHKIILPPIQRQNGSSSKILYQPQEITINQLQKKTSRRIQFTKRELVDRKYTIITNVQNIDQFLKNPIPQSMKLQATIVINKNKWNKFNPQYNVYISQNFRYLMSAKKKSCTFNSKYLISKDKDSFNIQNQSHLSTVSSNFLGTQFKISDQKQVNQAKVTYKAGCTLSSQPRKMYVFSQKQNLEQTLENEKIFYEYESKDPIYDQQKKQYLLNFQNRVKKSSGKNFILTISGTSQNIMIFGKVNTQTYHMDIIYPLSPVQAFGIALTSFDRKLVVK